jgi:hypothetical protein
MTDRLTRPSCFAVEQPVAPCSGARRPAACGGSSKSTATTRREADARQDAQVLQLDALYDRNNKTQYPSLIGSNYGVHVAYTTTSTTTPRTSGNPHSRGNRLTGDIVVLTDNDRYLSLISRGLGREARQVGDPEHEVVAVQQHPSSTRTATTACPGSLA